MPKPSKAPKPKRAFLYLGVYYTKSGRRFAYYDCGPLEAFTIPDTKVASNRVFSKALFKYGRPGFVYEVEADDTSATIWACHPKELGHLPDAILRIVELRHEADDQAHKNELAYKTKSLRRLCIEDLKHWKAAYARTDRNGRAALLARIVSYLEGSRSIFG